MFSKERIFSPVSSNITDVFFFVPGTNGSVPATASGFGAVFTDVDLDDGTRIQFFDASSTPIFDRTVPARSVNGKSFSFLGGMDDFIYAEPVPEAWLRRVLAGVVAAARSQATFASRSVKPRRLFQTGDPSHKGR